MHALLAPAGHCGEVPLHVAAATPTPPPHEAAAHTAPAFPGVAVHPVAGEQPSTVHGLPSLQVTAAPPLQAPPEHVSPVVQAFWSLHEEPSALVGFEHVPLVHVPATWHWSSAVHVTGVPLHDPLWQASPVVQASPSLHDVPFALGTALHFPVAGAQVPTLQTSESPLQSMGVPGLQKRVATLHVSLPLQGLPSSQSASFAQPHLLASCVHPPAASLQPSVVQAMPSSQGVGEPPHTPPVHASDVVQALPSLHDVPFAFAGFEQTPVPVLQVPAV
jgi:hypothetical protein